jgi:hypothetical protein
MSIRVSPLPAEQRLRALAGRRARTAALLSAVMLGVIVALLVIPDFSAWQHIPAHHRRG